MLAHAPAKLASFCQDLGKPRYVACVYIDTYIKIYLTNIPPYPCLAWPDPLRAGALWNAETWIFISTVNDHYVNYVLAM